MGRSVGRLRIVMVLENCSYPQDIRVRSEAETLAAAGYQVAVICPREAGQPWHEVLHGVHLHRFPYLQAHAGLGGYLLEFGYTTALLTLLVLWRWLRSGLDVVHVHNPPDTLFVAGLLPRLAGKRLVFDHHDLSAELYQAKQHRPRAWLSRVLRRLERLSCRWADCIIAANDSYRRNDLERNHVPPEKIWVVRNGPNLAEFPAAPHPVRATRPIIGYLGHIGRQDGVDQLLLALHALKDELGCQDWDCKVIGPADEPDELAALVKDLGLTGWVELLGARPHEEALRLLGQMDIGVAPEPYNPFNDQSTMIKVMEYMALGLPVVAYDLTEHRITAADTALYAQRNDPCDMARQIAALLHDPALRARLGEAGRQRAENVLAWPHSAERLLACYSTLTG